MVTIESLSLNAAMKKLKKLDCLTISRCNTKSSLSDSIPSDVLMDIISRLPAKSIPNCRRVSKLWASILRHPEFDELFLTKSPNRPLILFAFLIEGGLPFFTSPQDHENTSLQATPHKTYLPVDRFSKISPPVRGLVCLEDKRRMLVVCNPITGESVTLPKLNSEMMWSKSVFGYDPITKQFKVFCITWSPHNPLNTPSEHYVLTLGTGKMNWRKIQSFKPMRPLFDGGICINGVLYFIAKLNCSQEEDIVIVSFDARVEKLSFTYKPKDMKQIKYESRLINHKGQLGIFQSSNSRKIDRNTKSFDLWILEDGNKNEWTKRVYVLPLLWRKLVADAELRIVGMTGTCDIVLSPYYRSDPYYLFYYNLETNSVRRVGVRGFGAFEKSIIPHLFLDYAEDVKFI